MSDTEFASLITLWEVFRKLEIVDGEDDFYRFMWAGGEDALTSYVFHYFSKRYQHNLSEITNCVELFKKHKPEGVLC